MTVMEIHWTVVVNAKNGSIEKYHQISPQGPNMSGFRCFVTLAKIN